MSMTQQDRDEILAAWMRHPVISERDGMVLVRHPNGPAVIVRETVTIGTPGSIISQIIEDAQELDEDGQLADSDIQTIRETVDWICGALSLHDPVSKERM